MFLQKLREYSYSDRLDMPPTLYSESPVRYIIELDGDGRLLNPQPTDTADPSSPRSKRGVRRLVPQVQRSAGIKPLLLADNSEYTFGLGREQSKPERVAACNAAYRGMAERCAERTGDAAVRAVLTFLDSDPVAQLDLDEGFDRGSTVTFRVDGEVVVERPAVQSFWAGINQADEGRQMQCLVCGEEKPVLDRLQGKIKGIPGGQTSGTSIISANADAFTSYGLEASLVAPTCGECGERFTKSLNSLLSSQDNSIRLGQSVFIFWTREDTGFNFRTVITDPTPEQVRDLLDSIRGGRRTAGLDAERFYAASLSGSGGRAVVRDWLDTTVGEASRRVSEWFERQRIVDEWGREPRPLGLYALAGATVRDLKDVPTPTTRALLRTALTGALLPTDLLMQAVRRTRAQQTDHRSPHKVTLGQAALIKLVMLSWQHESEEGHMVQLNPEHSSPAYHCGRLLAVLEEVQRKAIPRLTTTVVDRFYGTASSAPASVFPRLLRGARPHLAKLERDSRAAHRSLESRLDEINGRLKDEFPRTLTLMEQGQFALGYYHQRAFDRAQAREASERRRAGTATAVDEEMESVATEAIVE